MSPSPKILRAAQTSALTTAENPEARLAHVENELARLTRQVALLDATLRLRDPILLRHGATDPALLSNHARVEAQDHLDTDSGFHPLEYALDGTAIRWTGPGRQSRLMLFLSRARPLSITLGVHDFGELEPESLRLSLDGDSLPVRGTANGTWVAGPWASRGIVAPTEIAIILPATTARQDANGAERAVGIAFTYLSVGPT